MKSFRFSQRTLSQIQSRAILFCSGLFLATLFILAPHDAFAERLFSSGCEFQSDGPVNAINDLEWDRSGSSGSVTQISSTTKRSGLSSCRAFSSTAGWGFFDHLYSAVDSDTPIYFRFYFKAQTMSTEDVDILLIRSSDSTVGSLVVNPDGTLCWLGWVEADGCQFTTPTPIITSNTWYRVEVMYHGDRWIIVRVDGKVVIDIPDNGSSGAQTLKLGMCDHVCGGDHLTAADYYFDDIAINDTAGTLQNSWPGSGSIVHMHPNAAGDYNTMCSVGNWTSVKEVTPDDGPSSTAQYICNLDANGDILDVNMESPVNAGIDQSSGIALVEVGMRGKPASSAGAQFNLRIKSQSLGLLSTSPAVTFDSNSWGTYNTNPNGFYLNNPGNYKLTSYTDPSTGCAWTQSGTNSLDNMQIGAQAVIANPDVYVSTLWALVEYNSNFQEPCKLASNGNPSDPITTALSKTSTYKQTKAGGFWARAIASDKLCLGSGSNCVTSWTAPAAKCRLEHYRVSARPGVLFGPDFMYPPPTSNYHNIATNLCDDLLSTASKNAGWVSTGYDVTNRVASSALRPPRVCQFMRLVCDDNVTMLTPTATGPLIYPVTDFTTSTNQCSDGIDNDGGGGIDYQSSVPPGDADCTSWSDNTE